MKITKNIKDRVKKGFDIRIEAGEKFYWFYKNEVDDWCCDIYVDGELDECNFFSDDMEVIEEIELI